MDRSGFLKRATAAELMLLAALAPRAAEAASARAGAAPRRGGSIRVGVIGNGASETYNPALYATPIETARGLTVFDPLVRVRRGLDFEPRLALRSEANRTATAYEIISDPGVRWHDGKRFTATTSSFAATDGPGQATSATLPSPPSISAASRRGATCSSTCVVRYSTMRSFSTPQLIETTSVP